MTVVKRERKRQFHSTKHTVNLSHTTGGENRYPCTKNLRSLYIELLLRSNLCLVWASKASSLSGKVCYHLNSSWTKEADMPFCLLGLMVVLWHGTFTKILSSFFLFDYSITKDAHIYNYAKHMHFLWSNAITCSSVPI